jgi:hypothetical protein
LLGIPSPEKNSDLFDMTTPTWILADARNPHAVLENIVAQTKEGELFVLPSLQEYLCQF